MLYKVWNIFVSIVLIYLLINLVVTAINNQELSMKNAIFGFILLACIVVNSNTLIKRLTKK